ncbi:hypothetical protein [Chitinophaga cymbidii]|uniref:Uncharacterized protein n=1 Tax=Chitinophaga cymbidii TaxID=1096750 RepID=A0A512RFJ9_9BACT|nr:hypothetical protein [Chitinophaga cymbidii]GEP94483.1 hypothetical protein CCY01nite_07430 [Chitinophaga cymbidii]
MQKSKTTVKANLFTSAKKTTPVKETKSKVISLTITPELEKHVKAYVEAKSQCKNWDAKLSIEEGFIKDKARDLYLEEYKKQGRNIGSFKLGDVTVSIQDRYPKMTDDVATIIAENFPGVIESDTEYLFNQEILKKHIEVISDALQNAEGIPEADLAVLIEAKETVNVKKGTIDTLAQYGEQMTDLFYAIAPIVSMR